MSLILIMKADEIGSSCQSVFLVWLVQYSEHSSWYVLTNEVPSGEHNLPVSDLKLEVFIHTCFFSHCWVLIGAICSKLNHEISPPSQINYPQKDTKTRRARGHKWIEILTEAADDKHNIKCLIFQAAPEEINKANKAICFCLWNPHSISQQNGPRWTSRQCLKIPPKCSEIRSSMT